MCARSRDRHHQVVAYSSDLTDDQWKILEPLLLVSSKRGPKHGADLRHVVDAMLYISHTGCQWRFLPGGSVLGSGSGPSFAGGRGTERGPELPPRCMPRRAPLSAERTRCPRRWPSTHISRGGPPMVA
ncbi:MAG: transposase [Acidimicrobiales bacterium]